MCYHHLSKYILIKFVWKTPVGFLSFRYVVIQNIYRVNVLMVDTNEKENETSKLLQNSKTSNDTIGIIVIIILCY